VSENKQLFAEVKGRVDLVDFIERYSGTTPQKRGKSYFVNPAPCCSHNDCFSITGPDFVSFNCYSCGAKGDVFNFVHTVQGLEPGPALKYVADQIGFQFPGRDKDQPQKKKTTAEWVAAKCLDNTDLAIKYLVDERGITKEVAEAAVKAKSVGFNTWTSPKVPPNKPLHGGPAVAFICKNPTTKQVMAVDMRYLDVELNGGVKTQCQGEKDKTFWTPDINKLRRAHTIYLVESSINALSIECCNMPGVAAVSILGTGNAENIDLHPFIGKQVILCMDNDEPNEKGDRPGAKASWVLHERCTALNISALMVDWDHWGLLDVPYNDVNDILKDVGAKDLKHKLKYLEQWVIPGLPGGSKDMQDRPRLGKSRMFLPAHDFGKYWLYRAKPDFTTYISKINKDDDGGADTYDFSDLCGFRVAGISRVTIAGATSTMTGEKDSQPKRLFSASVQTPRHKAELVRKVFDDESLHNVDQWKKFGPVFAPSQFSRMLSILERSSDLGAREAVNFVGLCWSGGKLIMNEGPDCYFQNPDQQCPYHNLTFPSGSPESARRVVDAYQATFRGNAAMLLLLWSVGAHMKVLLGKWPHFQLQAEKGTGKSTVIKRLERSIAMTMFSGQSLQTEFRLLTSISATSHPVGWEEISARRQDVIDKAVAMLQESYQYTVTKRGSDMTEYVLAAPVLLAGEDVPVAGITGKLVRASLKLDNQGELIPEDLPRFPLREWLQFLAKHSRAEVKQMNTSNLEYCQGKCRATGKDAGAKRMVENYAAMLTAWQLLCEFAGLPSNYGGLVHDLIMEMNDHISETSGDREPWVHIIEVILSEISRGKFHSPYEITRDEEGTLYLGIMPRDIMHHIRTESGLRPVWDALSVKTPRILKQQLKQAGVILKDDISFTAGQRRQTHATALSAERLAEFGLHVLEPDSAPPLAESA